MWLFILLAAGAAGYWFFLRPPKAQASLSLLDFGSTRAGRDGEQATVEISNVGRRPLEIRGVRVGGAAGDDYGIVDDGCTGASLTAEQSCSITLLFRPQASGGSAAGLEISSNAPGEPLGIPLSGTGLAPILTADRQSLDFGRIAVGKASGATVVALSNTGSAPMAVARMAIEGSGESSFVWVANGCSGQTLEAGESCAVRIAFQPREAGQFKAELRVWSDAPENPRVVVSGLGVAPGLFVQPTQIDFGALRPGQRSDARRVRLENTGNAALEISRLELAGADREAFVIEANDCDGKTLGADASCSVELAYRPSEPARHLATLRIRAPALRQRREVRLTGAALAPRLVVSAALLDFGRVVQYGTHERSLKLSNSGSAPLRLESIEIEGGGGAYGISDRGCPRELAAGADCTLGLRYSPSGLGGTEAKLRLRSNAAGSPLLISLLGTATALPKPGIAVEPGELRFEALPVGERSDILTLKVYSTGGARLELGGYELLGENAGDFRIVPASCEGLKSLQPGSDCTIGVRFRPQGAGRRRARIVVRHGASGGSSRVELRGEGF
ncbi:MAG: choice-of-anchor D domain-containing protein [Acidobacteria bacterium]|nr:choice-of-anchor D domain-containing protein [Acidobacteriota bacterium]